MLQATRVAGKLTGRGGGRTLVGTAAKWGVPVPLAQGRAWSMPTPRRKTKAVRPPVQVPVAAVASTYPETDHGPKFRWVRWFGAEYHFTHMQSICVACLWEVWEKRRGEVSDRHLLDLAGSDSRKLSAIFSHKHPAWGTMIVPGKTRGTHRLKPHAKN